MPKPKQTAIITVPQNWFDTAFSRLLPPGLPSTEAVHEIVTDLWETAANGIWLKGVTPTRLRHEDGSDVGPLDVLIPERYVLLFALVNDVTDAPLGFAPEATVLKLKG